MRRKYIIHAFIRQSGYVNSSSTVFQLNRVSAKFNVWTLHYISLTMSLLSESYTVN